MSKAKPFLFGTALGASAMFFSLQYHVVHSHDGFQVIPRTPQQSIGLAYTDIRGWTPSQWTDRPELARALMAHGSSDLIAESVASTLADSVTEDSSTLDELRSFLNNPKKKDGDDSEGLLRIPGSSRRSDAPGFSDSSSPIPFPQDLTQKENSTSPADPFRDPSDQPKGSRTSPPGTLADSRSSRFTVDDVLNGLNEDEESTDVFKPVDEPSAKRSGTGIGTGASTKPKSGTTQKSILDEAKEMEDRIFGGSEEKAPSGSASPRATSSKSSTTTSRPSGTTTPSKPRTQNDYGFDEVATELENRAQDVLSRAEEAAKSKAADMTDSASSYVRERASQLPEAARNAVKSGEPKIPADFDPFLE
jgi:hypothetical protein